jgi:predicted thioesterase
MNAVQKLGSLFFEEQHQVAVRTAQRAAGKVGTPGAAVDHLTPLLEQLCTRHVVQALGDAQHAVHTTQIALMHRAPALPGAQLVVRAWVQRVGWNTVSFELEVRDRFQLVCEGTLTLGLQRAAPQGARTASAPPGTVATAATAKRSRALLWGLFGLSNAAMAGRALPLILWCMASVLLLVATLFTLLPNAQQKTAQAHQQTQQAQHGPGG